MYLKITCNYHLNRDFFITVIQKKGCILGLKHAIFTKLCWYFGGEFMLFIV